ncbi:putative iron-dependent peroxidase [Mumia flava]|uniref:Putative iron-dependent peroxidase n=1 Tax=Mumia flava TaxID=1348852 RepID=A0A0B2BST7_9ACTN|nr:Dyp-type peroxidase [Mumia flava]PJJ57206.1 putative iron-dependent peroxidase [Mumia flava]
MASVSEFGEPQSVTAPLTENAVFLVVTLADDADAPERALDVLTDVDALVRAVGFRSLHGGLTCVVGIGSHAWDRMGLTPRPRFLHPFEQVVGDRHTAPSTPGDLLFHIRASRHDLCFELERLILDKLGNAVRVVDDTAGFRYFDARDLLGFVDGTENPTGDELAEVAYIDDEPGFEGGSYVITQRYTHDLGAWSRLSTEEQERIIGRTKIDDVELDDDVMPSNSHVTLNTVTDDEGNELDIVRFNMAFGSYAAGEVGTYFIGYAKNPSVTELMLRNMFVGEPPGNYDRILDFSTATTGNLYFVPSAGRLAALDELASDAENEPAPPPAPEPASIDTDGSLRVGSLRGDGS